jgi:hypothetical protein
MTRGLRIAVTSLNGAVAVLVVRTVVGTPEFMMLKMSSIGVTLPNLPNVTVLSRRKSRIADVRVAVRVDRLDANRCARLRPASSR